MYVCNTMYVCIYVGMYVCMYVCMYVSIEILFLLISILWSPVASVIKQVYYKLLNISSPCDQLVTVRAFPKGYS